MKKIIGSVLLFSPALAFAAGLDGFITIANNLASIVTILIPVAFGVALLFFFWGLAKYILSAGDEAKKDEGKRIMIWGTIALFIMASIWGIVIWAQNALGITATPSVPVPSVTFLVSSQIFS